MVGEEVRALQVGDGLAAIDVTAHGRPAALTVEERWRLPIGSGYSGVVIVAGRLYTMTTDGTHDLVVALDAGTGTVRWSFQTVHRDVWDFDVASQPTLFQIAGVGGDEAGIWAGDLLEMYRRAAADRGWKLEWRKSKRGKWMAAKDLRVLLAPASARPSPPTSRPGAASAPPPLSVTSLPT